MVGLITVVQQNLRNSFCSLFKLLRGGFSIARAWQVWGDELLPTWLLLMSPYGTLPFEPLQLKYVS